MDRKVAAIRSTISELEAIDRAVGGDVIDTNDALARKLAKFMDSLSALHEEGRSMDESSMLQIPLELFDHLDSADASNPELYQMKMIDDAEAKAAQVKQKISSLEALRVKVECGIPDKAEGSS